MASLIYTSNKLGTLTGPSSASGSVDITFTSKSQADSIVITLFCHACKQVISSGKILNVNVGDVRTVSFDLSSLESSGHPGPFEFTPTGGEGEIYLDVVLRDDPPGAAKSFTGAGTYVVPFGGGKDVRISVSDNDGYSFYRWEYTSGVEAHTSRGFNIHFNNLVRDTTYELVAKFRSLAGVFVQAFIETLPTLPNVALVEDQLTGDTAESMTKVAPEGEYSVTYAFKALRLSARYFCYGRYSRSQQNDGTWSEWNYYDSYRMEGTTSRSRKIKFTFRELNAIKLAIRFHWYGHSTHDANLTLFVDEEDDNNKLPMSQGPFVYSSDAVASLYATNARKTSLGVGYGLFCRMSCKLNIGSGVKLVKVTLRRTDSDGSYAFSEDFFDTSYFERRFHEYGPFYFKGNEFNSVDIFLECGRLMYNVTGYLIYDPSSNALVYCG